MISLPHFPPFPNRKSTNVMFRPSKYRGNVPAAQVFVSGQLKSTITGFVGNLTLEILRLHSHCFELFFGCETMLFGQGGLSWQFFLPGRPQYTSVRNRQSLSQRCDTIVCLTLECPVRPWVVGMIFNNGRGLA